MTSWPLVADYSYKFLQEMISAELSRGGAVMQFVVWATRLKCVWFVNGDYQFVKWWCVLTTTCGQTYYL